jgi:2-polyprenyl-3-methyl-5-hydroxy-6-metoxy-1,4-benzoquinol methylase
MENMDSSGVEALNDELAIQYPIDDYYEKSSFLIRFIEHKRLSIIRKFLGNSAGLQVAEIGSGGGHVLRMFSNAQLTAIDVSSVYLETARKNLTGYNVRFLKGEVDKLDLPDQSFDRIICTEVLEHTKNPDAILATIARLLKPNGVAAVTVPNDPLILKLKSVLKHSPVGWILQKRIQWGGDEYHLHRWTPREFEKLLSQWLRVTHRVYAPFKCFPIRSCFRCVPL